MTDNTRDKICSVLQEIHPVMESLAIHYCVIGSAALILSGINIGDTKDIDILVSSKDADRLKHVWADFLDCNYVTQHDDLFRSNFARYNLKALDVEIIGDLEVNKQGQWLPLNIQETKLVALDNNIVVKIPTLEEQKRILIFFGREKDSKRMKQILQLVS